MVEEKREPYIHPEINPQLWILNAVNYAIRMRQDDPKTFRHAVSGVWCALFPSMKEDLLKKLDEAIPDMSAKEIRDFNKDGFETSYDLFACLESKLNGLEQDKKTKAGEILLNYIQEVLREAGLSGEGRKMPSYRLKPRRVVKKDGS
jgi:hypothetical protein